MLSMTKSSFLSAALLGALALAGCSGDDSSTGDTATTTTSPTTTDPSTTSPETTGTTTTDPTATTTTATTTDPTATTTETTTTGDDPFMFDDADPASLSQVDRMGMPAINTAVITSKDKYNQATPADDVMGTYVPEIIANLTGLHAALDDDLAGFGLTPCVAGMSCVDQAGPLVVPDTLKLSLGGTAGFPNGRKLADPVMDVTLAVVLLDLEVHDAGTLAGVPLNPPANDVAFLADFPYLAAPH